MGAGPGALAALHPLVREALTGPRPLRLGINYPWGTANGRASYGWDFGNPFRGDPAEPPPWAATVEADLQVFADLGLDVVRWFVLADGLAYGRVADTPGPGTLVEDRAGTWRATPGPLAPGDPILADFTRLLELFSATRGGVRLLPVFVDGVELARAAGREEKYRPRPASDGSRVLKGGRRDLVADQRHRFFEAAIGPLVDACLAHRDAVHALELVNEPEMLGWSGVPASEVAAFVRDGVAFLRDRAGEAFPVTVGYQYWDGFRDPAWGSAAAGCTLPQHHYYGEHAFLKLRGLPRPPKDAPAPLLGEIPIVRPPIWPPTFGRFRRSLRDRLAVAADHGYEHVLLWSAQHADQDPVSRFWA